MSFFLHGLAYRYTSQVRVKNNPYTYACSFATFHIYTHKNNIVHINSAWQFYNMLLSCVDVLLTNACCIYLTINIGLFIVMIMHIKNITRSVYFNKACLGIFLILCCNDSSIHVKVTMVLSHVYAQKVLLSFVYGLWLSSTVYFITGYYTAPKCACDYQKSKCEIS